jgi:site-specific DNA recombinase
MSKCVLYARVSSLKQEEGYSIPAQLDQLRDYAKRNNLSILKEFTDVESAKEPGRKNFTKMMEFARRRKDVVILVEKVDRLYRSLHDYIKVEESGVTVHFVKGGGTMSPDDLSHQKLIQGIQALMARHYIQNLGEEAKKGM